MAKDEPVVVSGAVEGSLDNAVLRRLIEHAGAEAGPISIKDGKAALHQRIHGYNNASRFQPWMVLVDLNHDAECAPLLLASWLPRPAPSMCFRVAVRQVEAWLLADRERIARFLSIAISRVPSAPETLDNPKQVMVDLARQSRKRGIREDMVPRPKSGRKAGPAYTSRLIEFVRTKEAPTSWQPDEAAESSDSLSRCIRCIRQLVKRSK